MPSSRRDALIDTASALFDRDGFHATGIDKVLAEAGVAKMTLYKHFRSKDELILAALRRRDETFRNSFIRRVERKARDPRGRLLAVFEALGEWFEESNFHGCLFMSAAAEFKSLENPIHAACAEHKRLMVTYLRGLAEAAGADDPLRLAKQLNLLIEGASATAHVCGGSEPARLAQDAARTLIEAALGPKPR
ncbi:MAG: TetR/AcrR family transcriptional regulator [Kiloniellales bacterium]|nr:TetR/AcrR family transcriptional regulator [Kiloniellales bacterium]